MSQTKMRWRTAAILGTTALVAPFLLAGQASAQSVALKAAGAAAADAAPVQMEELVVTAQRREEKLQNVPISIQALGQTTLAEHHVLAMDDYAKMLPSVSFQTLGPGRSDLFFRGISTGAGGLLPTSGLYLDDVPVQTSGRLLDMHLYDIARVEALSGPQGTLFGASSLAGTLRIITNKPDPSHFSAAYDVQADKYGKGAAGGMTEGYVNIPLNDRAAVRLVGYYDHLGGYIDNTPGSITYTFANQFPGQSLTVNNASMVKKDFNPVTTYGGRVELGVELDDNWTITPELLAQTQKSKGSFLYDPKLADLTVHDYGPTSNHDSWYQAAATLQGHTAVADIVYSGGYLHRNTATDNDYTYYTVSYDSIPGYTHIPDGKGGLLNPTQRFTGKVTYAKLTQELRVSLPTGHPYHLTAGLFYQQQTSDTTSNYYIPGLGATGSSLVIYNDDVFYIRTHAVNKDYAGFAEGSYDFTPDLTLTAGVRVFVADNTSKGFSGVPGSAKKAGCAVQFTDAESQYCINRDQHISEHGETPRLTLNYKIDSDRMVYATYSTGFRPGGANTLAGVNPYDADTLSNYELGIKSTWFGRLRWNAAVYYEKWSGLQYRLVVPGNNGIGATYNAGDARVYGVETDFQWRIQDFTLSGTASYNDSRLSKDLCNLGADKNPLPTCSPGDTTAAPKGTRLPSQPLFKTTITARYDFSLGRIDAFAQGVVMHQTDTRSYLSTFEDSLLGDTPAFTTVDFSLGGKLDGKSLELFIQNAFDKRGQLTRNTFCAITICSASTRVYPVGPQFFGVKFGQQF